VRAATLLIFAAALGLAAGARADEPQSPSLLGPYSLDGAISAGYRWVNVDGSKSKYNEDYDLNPGARLFLLDVNGQSKTPDKTPVDRFHLQVDTPGDEPVSRFLLTAADTQRFDLRVDFTRSKYFYDVQQLFADPVTGDNRVDDLHKYNLTGTNGLVDLTVRLPNKLPTLLFGYRLYERDGPTVSTVVYPGNNFLVDAPLHSVTHVGLIGTEFTALGTSFFIQQQYRRVLRTFGEHGPIDVNGVDPASGVTLFNYQADQHDQINIPVTIIRASRSIGDRLELTGDYFFSHAGLSSDRTRFRDGAGSIPAANGSQTQTDHSTATLNTNVADLAGSLRLTDWAAMHVAYRFNERTQTGELDNQSDLGTLFTATGDQVRYNTVTGDFELRPRRDLTLLAGVRYTARDAHFTLPDQQVSTSYVGVVAEGHYRPTRWVDFLAKYENVQVDDPWFIPGDPQGNPALPAREIAFTSSNRGIAGVHLRPRDWLSVNYEFQSDTLQNPTFNGTVQRFGNTIAVSGTPVRGLDVFLSYTHRSLDNRGLILYAPVYTPTTSVQNGDDDVFTTQLTYDFKLFGKDWSTGWNVAYVNSQNTLRPNLEPGLAGQKLYDLSRVDAGWFFTYHTSLVDPGIEFRRIVYNEPSLPRNDYDATILLFRITKRFNF
jgi:hypothetical protein